MDIRFIIENKRKTLVGFNNKLVIKTMEDYINLGDEFYEKAEDTLISKGCLPSLSREEKIEKAINLYKQAINYYKLNKSYNRIGTIYIKIAELESQPYYIADNYLKAADTFLKVDRDKAITCYKKAIEVFTSDGKLINAARIYETLAEIHKEDFLLTEAIKFYQKAYDYYEIENQPVTAHKCLSELTYLLIECEEYESGFANLEKMAEFYSKTLVHYKCSQFYFEMIIIQMFLEDIVECKKLLNKYGTKIKEYDALSRTISAYESYDSDAFSQALQSCNLNNSWHVSLLLKVKDRLDVKGDEL